MEAVEAGENLRELGLIKEEEGKKKKIHHHNIFLFVYIIVANCITEISVAPNGVT